MDGTLIDTEPLWGVATYELSEKLGRRLTPELREKTIGGSFGNTLAICAAHAGVELGPGDYVSYPGDGPHLFAALEPGTTAVLVSEHA